MCLAAVSDMHNFSSYAPIWQRFISWQMIAIVFFVVFFAFQVGLTKLIQQFKKTQSPTKIYLTALLLVTSLIATVFGGFTTAYFKIAEPFTIVRFVREFSMNVGMILLIEILIIRFVLQMDQRVIRVTEEATERKESILINGELFELNNICHISANGRYMDITFLDGSKRRVSGYLGETSARLPDDIGILIHRSHWVAYSQISEIITQSRSTFCVLRNGGVLPIARTRRSKVEAEWENYAMRMQITLDT
jgi:DNA-binding LytR/AlgR family response regulator